MSPLLVTSSTRRLLVGAFAVALCTLAAGASAQAQGHTAASPSATASAPTAASGVVNINTASAEELDRLPGVGPGRAKAILELRTHVKRFEKLEDLMRVKGIGRDTFRKLRPMLTLEGATTLTAASATHTRHSAQQPN